MRILATAIPEVLIIEPCVHEDARGFLMESWNERLFNEAVGREVRFVQDNHSRSTRGVLRGLHYQLQQTQGKLMRVLNGRVFDVVVDLRRGAPTFGASVAVELSDENRRQLWVPEGFAHGFLVLSERVDFLYKITDYHHPASEQSLLWCDPALGIDWPLRELGGAPLLSARDLSARPLREAATFPWGGQLSGIQPGLPPTRP